MGRPQSLGDFELLREIGRGGAGTVWEAWQTPLRRLVAVKVLSPRYAASETARERFRVEAEAGARLNHPGIVAVHQVGEHDGALFIAQELIEGGRTFGDWLDEERRRDPLPADHYRTVAALVADAADALQAAHESGVVHRDVKPSNLLLTRDGRLKVADFGIARIGDALALSRTGELLGTPYYMSPEQVDGRRAAVGAQSDVFSLGATLYEALAFARPFEGDTGAQVMQRILTEDPADPRSLRSRVPRDLALVCMRALEKEPARRYASMAEFAEDLRRFLAGENVSAREPSAFEVARRWVRRHPAIAGAGAIGAIALSVIGGLAWRLADEAERAKRAESQARADAERARDEADTSRQVIDFLLDSFVASDPEQARGVELSARQVLDRGAERIDSSFESRPAVRARILHTLGSVYEALGQYPRANDLLQQALDLRRETLGTEDPETLSTANMLGGVLIKLSRFEEAHALLVPTFETRRRILGPDHADTADVAYNLGFERLRTAHAAEAEPLLRAALETQRRARSAGHVTTLKAASGLGMALLQLGRLSEARVLLEESVATSVAELGESSQVTMSLLVNLAMVQQALGDVAAAEATTRRALAVQETILGPEHPHRLLMLANLATLTDELGRTDEAIEILDRVIEGRAKVLPADDPGFLLNHATMGWMLTRSGDLSRAEPYLRRALEGLAAKQGREHPNTWIAINNLAHWCESGSRFEEAEPLAREVWQKRRAGLGPAHAYTLISQEILARSLAGLGRREEALTLARELVELTPAQSTARKDRDALLASLANDGAPPKDE